jgi:fido (protein-threonine AMPylation protein)
MESLISITGRTADRAWKGRHHQLFPKRPSSGSLPPIMELQILDPFGDYETAGYLRNVYGVKDLELIGHLETAVFQQEVLRTVRALRRVQTLQYQHILETHRQFFNSL